MNERVEFKRGIQAEIKNTLIPVFRQYEMKKGRSNFFLREQNDIIQFICLDVKQANVKVWGGMTPIYLPLTGYPYKSISLGEKERWITSMGVCGTPVYGGGFPYEMADENISEWKCAEKIIIDSILPQFNQVLSLNQLMEHTNFVANTDVWRGIKLYAEGTYSCLSSDLLGGFQKLKQALELGKTELEHRQLSNAQDEVSTIYGYAEKLFYALEESKLNKEIFLSSYHQVCAESREWFKIKK